MKVNLSNGESSPRFQNDAAQNLKNLEVKNFEKISDVRQVAAYHNFDDKSYHINRIQFNDKDGNRIYSYNPGKSNAKVATYKLKENHELIGIYGIRGKAPFNRISAFGFIVKVTE